MKCIIFERNRLNYKKRGLNKMLNTSTKMKRKFKYE